MEAPFYLGDCGEKIVCFPLDFRGEKRYNIFRIILFFNR